jgi:hypothetical protein
MKLLKLLGMILLVTLCIPIIIIFLILSSPIILYYFIQSLVRRIFKSLRNDPICKIPTYTYGDYTTPPTDIISLKELFNQHIEQISKSVKINSISEIAVAYGTDNPEYDILEESDFITLTTNISSDEATAKLSMEAMRFATDAKDYFSQEEDYAPFLVVSFAGKNGVVSKFNVIDDEDFFFLVSSLKNGQNESSVHQIWTRITDSIYMVCYVPLKPSGRIQRKYGFRKEYSTNKARQYFYDK